MSIVWGTGAMNDGMSGYLMEGALFPFRRLLGSTIQKYQSVRWFEGSRQIRGIAKRIALFSPLNQPSSVRRQYSHMMNSGRRQACPSNHDKLLLHGYNSPGGAFLLFSQRTYYTHSRRNLLSTCNNGLT